MLWTLFGWLLSIPYMFLFYALWILSCLFRPVMMASVLCLAYNPQSTLKKVRLFVMTVTYLALCHDKKWTEPKEDPASFFADSEDETIEKKTIIFVRHGESTWNDTFNKGDRSKVNFLVYFVPNLIYAAAMEFYWFVSGTEKQSWFFDAPLSNKGVSQARGIQTFLETGAAQGTNKEAELIGLMLGNTKNEDGTVSSQLVSSNLRRAISTVAMGFQDRLDKELKGDSILICPELQEISRNPDALSILESQGRAEPSFIDQEMQSVCDMERILGKQVDTRLHMGNKPTGSNGLVRMNAFCETAFNVIEKDSIIVGGHSLWFRSFFRSFLPRTFEHVSKKKKIVNGGIVAFTLLRIKDPSGYHYMMDPASITVLYGGF
eukprot:CAMPEP_0198288346 /NCGR_PEP_ID=MMETSP1449-20131203/6869_1 /TAXON_ID=420275 /ORGANISM="Attheya septentrionalis, Strain CCMP2084" /LENGTH=375 /DNA_ID=CAMNT_0043986461 /DNA_START=108 /DNA_END=1235 /DNA_ORIENTATION=+